jgi:hypothetical protein
LKVSKYSLLAHLYFFFNSVLLPKGLLFTNILSPVFYYNLIRDKRKTYFFQFALFLITYDSIHLYFGVDPQSFIISNGLFISTYFCVVSFYHFVNNYDHLARLFKQIVITNAVFAAIAIPFFFFPKEYQEWFWYVNKLTKGLAEFPRLALFTYEASYYSLLLIPVFYYYILKFIFNTLVGNKWFILAMVGVPMLMSLSFGVLGATLLTALILFLIFIKRVFVSRRAFYTIISIITLVTTVTVFLLIYFPENALFVRLRNISEGADTSANGRTVDSFTMAWRIIDIKNIYFGAGLGQIKIMVADVVHKYYNYWGKFPRYDIPNAIGETLAIFGVVGVVFRLFLEFWLFFRTRVYTNYYRLALFIFVFIYQFTGSFITNIVEYVIWILAFSNVFEQFNITKRKT